MRPILRGSRWWRRNSLRRAKVAVTRQGRLLRERLGFAGELRARGVIRRDHVFLLARCGFNSFELPESELEGAAAALRTFSAAYQSSSDRGLGAALRHR